MDGSDISDTSKKKGQRRSQKKPTTKKEEKLAETHPSSETSGQDSDRTNKTEDISRSTQIIQEEGNKKEERSDKCSSEKTALLSDPAGIASLHPLEPFDSGFSLSSYGELAGLSILNTLHDLGSQQDANLPVAPLQEQPAVCGPLPIDPFRQDEDGDTILHLSVVQEDPNLSDFLISKMRPRLDIYNNLRQTPLHLAVITKNIDIIKSLLLNGADVNKPDRNGQTSMHLAVKTQDLVYSQTILDTLYNAKTEVEPVDLEVRNFEGFTSLHLATMTGNRDLIGHLLAHGANIEAKDSKSGRTCLHHAVEANNETVVEYLLKNGAIADAKTYAGNTALHTASGRNMESVYRLLLMYGGDVNLKNIEGDSPGSVKKESSSKSTQPKKTTSKKKKK